jgi:hypothetical protein
MDKLLKELEDLRTTLADFACGIEITRGENDPGAKAYRDCIGRIYRVMEPYKTPTN